MFTVEDSEEKKFLITSPSSQGVIRDEAKTFLFT